MQIGRLAARAVIGGLFIGHGTQKLFGWFGGPGLEGTDQMMKALDLQPSRANSLAAGLSESVGGTLLIAGAATPLAASSLIGTMITAIRKVHQPKGPWVAQGGWEYNAVLIAAVMALVDAGPGDVSVDAARGHREWGPQWALGALALGAVASTAVIESGRRQAARSAQPASGAGPVARAAREETAGDPVTTES